MSRLAYFQLKDGSSIAAEVDDHSAIANGSRTMRGGLAADVLIKAGDSLDAALDNVREAANALVDRLSSLTRQPDEISVEFGVKLNAEAGAVIAKGTAEANFQITLKWTKPVAE